MLTPRALWVRGGCVYHTGADGLCPSLVYLQRSGVDMRNLIVLAVLAFSTTASAGYHYAWEVYTSVYEYRGHVQSNGFGSVAGALASADEWQFIDCAVTSYLWGGTPTTTGVCSAADAAGALAVCF